MESVGVAAALHDTAGLLVDDFDFVFVNHILHILLKECVGFEKLYHGVHSFGFHCIVLHKLILAQIAFGSVRYGFSLRELGCDIGKHEESGVGAGACQFIDTLVSQLYAAVLFVNHEVERLCGLGHLT